MTFDQLKKLCESNEIRVDNHSKCKRTPPYYYDSLRHALETYFKTFRTHNAVYDSYAEGMNGRNTKKLSVQLLDEDNTVLTLTSFERFFELFFKDLLGRVSPKLTHISKDRLPNKNKALILVQKIESKTFSSKKFKNKLLSISFREAIDRFNGLAELSTIDKIESQLISKFARLLKKYSFLYSENIETSMRISNWYRDRILHNGNRLPSLWLLDYIVTQHFIPIIAQIINWEKSKLGEGMFYLTTVTGIDIIQEFLKIKYRFEDLSNPAKQQKIFRVLLYIGHLKELGRASLEMNLLIRNNISPYEYNYRDPIGRGKRFAQAEKEHPHFKNIKDCVCCSTSSMVVYEQIVDDIFNPGQRKSIEWLKCYTCDYHIRINVGDPSFFNLYSEAIFESPR